MISKAINSLRRLLTRETSSGRFVPEIDGLRFFAIALVMVFHVEAFVLVKSAITFSAPPERSWVHAVVSQGFIGVRLFFAISGFILAVPFARRYLEAAQPVSLRAYFLRRVTRIEPPYVIATTVSLFSFALVKHIPVRELLPHWAASIFYVHHLLYNAEPLLGVGWSLEIEVQFYLLAPLLTRVFSIHSRPARLATLAGGAVFFAALQRVLPPGAHFNLVGQLHFFLVGFILADFYIVNGSRPARRPALWDWAALAAWPALLWGAALPARWMHLATSPAILVICLAAFRGRLWRRIVCHRWLVIIGGMCYTIYLYHSYPKSLLGRRTIHLALTTNFNVNLLLQYALLIPTILLLSAVLFVLFEKPFMRRDWFWMLMRKLGVQARPAVAGVESRAALAADTTPETV
ncbi:MAG: acyltransferase [Phycisphaerales bacterium]|nr:acyltransferase [Phycisphaerales bacterium]